jgi:hypothetical protein
VKILVDRTQPAGDFQVVWDGRDQRGNLLPEGIYYSVLRSGASEDKEKLVKLS